jgi:pimeloyl-ACP methyl ester carboxylesterase
METVHLAGVDLKLIKGGRGAPLLILHDEMGHPGWLRFHESLAENFTLYIPQHPGFGESPPVDWVMNMRDLAGWYLEALDDLGLGPINVLGSSIVGWLAAEMATMFKNLVLLAATGVRPPQGEIFDIFQVVAKSYLEASVLDKSQTPEFSDVCPDEPSPEVLDAWDAAREGACLLSWRPYMHYPNLPHLLSRLKNLPTLIIWGRDDAIVPLSAGELYHSSIPGSELVVLDHCGHRPDIEKPSEVVEVVNRFLGT